MTEREKLAKIHLLQAFDENGNEIALCGVSEDDHIWQTYAPWEIEEIYKRQTGAAKVRLS